ncbi:MAG TPA: FadR/GntR family transcriptional regulator [Burkholderiaceae bacterium]|nr:FadR/GntR family transcriptional regulator [Burkholderiaceae bacterium]
MSSRPASNRAATLPARLPGPPANSLVRSVLTYLQERRFEPGDRLPSERMLAERLNVGRNSLREAFAVLNSLRVIEIRPNSGVYLRRISSESSFEQMVLLAEMGSPPTPQEILETIEVRDPLEREAVRLACERRTESDLQALREVVEQERTAAGRGENTAAFDQAFHRRLVESAHNSVLLRVLNSFYQLSLKRREVFFSNPVRGRESAGDHAKLLAAIEARDVATATALIVTHLQRARLYWSELLDSDMLKSEAVRREGRERAPRRFA